VDCRTRRSGPCPFWVISGHDGNPAEIALAFKDAYRMLNQRIGIFTALPLRSLDKLSLQTKLNEIGRA
jgi:hypothetical protein